MRFYFYLAITACGRQSKCIVSSYKYWNQCGDIFLETIGGSLTTINPVFYLLIQYLKIYME